MPLWENPEIAKAFIRGMGTGPNQLRKTGSPCPECKEELMFSENGVVHLDPPRRRVKCSKCQYRGFLKTEEPPEGIDIVKSIEDKQTRRKQEDDN